MDNKNKSAQHYQGQWIGLYLLIISLIAALIYFWRIQSFGDLEPRSDQAFLAWWVKGLVSSNHVLPHIEQGEQLIDALARDEKGILTQLLRPIYNSPTELFKIIPIIAYTFVAQIFGDSYSNQVAISIFTSVAIPFVLALYPIWGTPHKATQTHMWIGFIALILSSTSLYLHVFSGWGIHNAGILTLVIAGVISNNILSTLSKSPNLYKSLRPIIELFLINALAIYSFKTNLFLLPLATVFTILALPEIKWQRKFNLVFCYGSIVTILILPFIPLTLISANKSDFAQDMTSPISLMLAGLSSNLFDWPLIIYNRTESWLVTAYKLYSLPGLIIGILGLYGLARKGMRLPFYILIAHYISWCFIPIFAGVLFRTYPYLIPFLGLGGAYFIVVSFRGVMLPNVNKKLLATIASYLLIAHFVTQIPIIRSKEHMANVLPQFWSTYFTGQGQLRPIIAEIEQILPNNAVLMTWGYGLQFLYRDLKTTGQDIELPAINALMLRQKAGLLLEHIKKRHLSLSVPANIYILVDHKIDHIDRQTLTSEISTLLGPKGFAIANDISLKSIGAWQLKSSWPKNITLYKVSLNK